MTQRTIVIIERDTVFAQTCAGEFQRNGYRVHLCTGTLVGVIDSLRQHVPSLILLNASAVSADLEEVIELLRLNTKKDTHIAVITDTSDANASRYIRQLGADSCFSKPVEPTDICREICSHHFTRPEKPIEMSESEADNMVALLILKLGVPAHMKGYFYLRKAILLSLQDMSYLHHVTKLLYPTVANSFSTTPSRVERALRHLIGYLWENGNEAALNEYFVCRPARLNKSPSNHEFIATVVDRIKLQSDHRNTIFVKD